MGNDLEDDATGVDIISNQAAGSYYATLTHIATGCAMVESVEIEVDDKIVLPLVTVVEDDPDQNCSGTADTGILTAMADGVTAGYTFDWFSGTTAGPAGTGDAGLTPQSNQATGLNAGDFTVLVVNTTTGCEDTQTIALSSDPLMPVINTFTTVGSTNCEPGNGEITITGISTGAISDYTYNVYDQRSEVESGTPVLTSATATITGLAAGTYYVTAVHNLAAIPTNCTSPAIEIEVEDLSTAPVISIATTTLQSNCDPTIPNGSISVLADDQVFGYTFAWYAGDAVDLGNEISNTQTATGLSAGKYTVSVTNDATGCTSLRTYNMIDNVQEPIELATSTSPNFNCAPGMEDGRMSVKVLNPNIPAEDYDYLWYQGDIANPDINNPFFTGNLQEGVIDGTYTVLVVDPSGGCESLPTLVVIEDATNTMELMFEITEEQSMTNCIGPNAILSAAATSGVISDYRFEWYAGVDNTGTSMGDRLKYDSLTIGSYHVEMYDRYTGCMVSQTVEVNDSTEVVTGVETTIISDRTNCTIPNGEVLALVNGETFGYSFEWTDQANAVVSSGSSATGLDVGSYNVTVTSNATGCDSDPVAVNVSDITREPKFFVENSTAFCDLDDGKATMVFDFPIEVDSVRWTKLSGNDSGPVGEDLSLNGMSGGEYHVFLKDKNNCTSEQSFIIETEIVIYNGVSDNGDGKNDIFYIACADLFTNNSVKIYNRTGTLVYKADSYNNNDVVFNGQSNTGLSSGTGGLPEGTYFYVFDKGDGDKEVQGYLELVR